VFFLLHCVSSYCIIESVKDPGENLIKAAEEELARLLAEKAELDRQVIEYQRKIAAVQRTVEMLQFAYNPPQPDELETILATNPGITDQVRSALKSKYPAYCIPTAIRDHIERVGGKPLSYKNPMAVIHQVLRRLEEQGEVEPSAEGPTSYRWKQVPRTGAIREMASQAYGVDPTYMRGVTIDPMTAAPIRSLLDLANTKPISTPRVPLNIPPPPESQGKKETK
jgi:hypothetical protein